MATNETFVLDGVTKDFATELSAVASQIEAMANPDDLRVSVNGNVLEILNIRDDGGSFGFGVSQALESPALTDVTAGTAYFRPEHGSDGTLDDETGTIQLTAGVTGISTGGRVDSAPDLTSALQFEENKIYRFRGEWPHHRHRHHASRAARRDKWHARRCHQRRCNGHPDRN